MTNKSNRQWLREHFSDVYVKRAQQAGYRSRAVFKLMELQERDRLFKPGMTIVDLGAAPGGWSQFVIKQVQPKGCVIAVDILPMDPIDDVVFLQADFCDETTVQGLLTLIDSQPVDWVISDMAPNLSGVASVDQARSMALSEAALAFAERVLGEAGGLLIKTFQGEGFDAFLKEVRRYFPRVVIRKPKASRSRSNEVYILAKKC